MCGLHEILFSFNAIDGETNHVGKSTLKRIVSAHSADPADGSVAKGSIEYEYREAEYEYEGSPNKALDMERRQLCPGSVPNVTRTGERHALACRYIAIQTAIFRILAKLAVEPVPLG